MSTSISTASTALPHRVRLSVPAADVSTMEWLKRQDNISQSLRFLVRDYIERNGYTDPTSRPVRQLPRRGRPPLHDDGQESDQQEQLEQQESSPRFMMADELGNLKVPVKRAELRKQSAVASIQAVTRQAQTATQAPAVAAAQTAAQAPAAVPAAATQPAYDPGSTPGASGVGSFLSASRGDDDD